MNEGSEAALSGPTSVGKTAGAILRAAREREGLHVAALAVSIKVPVKKLEALEADRFDLLPDAVFVRALAGSVCRALKVDPSTVMNLLPAGGPAKLKPDGRGINAPFDSSTHGGSYSFKSAMAKPSVLIVILLLLAALGVFFFPETSGGVVGFDYRPEPEAVQSTASESNVATIGVAATAATPYVTVDKAVPSNVPGTVGIAASNQIQVDQSATSPASVASLKPVETSPSNGSPTVNFRAKGEAWVQVTDAKGVQLVSRILNAGEVLGLTGSFPFAVIVGRSDLTTVELDGKVIDLARHSQNNVARFELKP